MQAPIHRCLGATDDTVDEGDELLALHRDDACRRIVERLLGRLETRDLRLRISSDHLLWRQVTKRHRELFVHDPARSFSREA